MSPLTPFRLDQLFNYGGSVEYQDGELALPGSPGTPGQPATGPDPVLAQFQATDPATGKPYAADFGWLSHTYDTPYLDVGCATQDYIEAELNQNTNDVLAAPGAVLPGLGVGRARHRRAGPGLGHPGRLDRRRQRLRHLQPPGVRAGQPLRLRRPGPGTPATVDPPDLDEATPAPRGDPPGPAPTSTP